MYSNRNALIATLSVAGVLGACGGAKEAQTARKEAAPVTVQVAAARIAKVPVEYTATGTVKARVTSVLSARIMGYIREVRVQAGDSVKEGQTVAILDARDIENSLRQAEAGRAEAKSAIPEVDNAIAAAKAQMQFAQSTHKRIQTLFDQKSITPQELDEVTAKLRMAQANYEMALSKRQQLEEKIKQAEQAVAQVALQRSYADVKAPFNGVVIERKSEPGMLASPGTPILVVEQSGGYRLEANVDESQMAKIRAGSKATVELDAVGKPMEAPVTDVVPALDAMSRTFVARISLPGGFPYRTGMFGRARFVLGEREAVIIPSSALRQEGQVQQVFLVQGGVARSQLVTTGSARDGIVQVLSGLTGAETLVSPLPASLLDGARVEVRQ